MRPRTSRPYRSRLALSSALLVLPFLPAAPAVAAGCGDTPGRWHLHGESGAEFQASIGFVGVWRPGAQAPNPELGVIAEPSFGLAGAGRGEPEPLVGAPGDGRSVADFERYEIEGVAYYAFVFQAGEAGEALLPNLSGAAAVKAQMESRGGMHLEDFEAFREGGDWRFAALFREGPRSLSFETEVAGSQVQAKLASRHLTDFEVLSRGPAEPTFALLLGDGGQDQLFFASLAPEEFHRKAHDPSEAMTDYRLADVEVWKSSAGETRLSAVFEKAGLADHLWVGPCGSDCNRKASFASASDHLDSRIAALKAKKPALRLVDLELPLDPEVPQPPDAKKKAKAAPRLEPRKAAGPRTLGTPAHDGDDSCSHAGVLHDTGTDGPP